MFFDVIITVGAVYLGAKYHKEISAFKSKVVAAVKSARDTFHK